MRKVFGVMLLGTILVFFALSSVFPGTFELGIAKAETEPQSPYTISEFTVAQSSGQESDPAISGTIVVWVDRPGGLDGNYTPSIKIKNLSSGEVSTISSTGSWNPTPSIDGRLVVWEDSRSDYNGDIYAYDLTQKREYAIANGLAAQSEPDVSGNIIVWLDGRNGKSDVYGYDINTETEFPIATGPGNKSHPKISGNTVVWQVETDEQNGQPDFDIYGCDLATHREFPIATGPALQYDPDISGSCIVWSERQYNSPNYAIRRLDTDSGNVSTLAAGVWEMTTPAISGNIVVWVDGRDSTVGAIYGYDLAKQQEFPVDSGIGSKLRPAIDGLTVVWTDNRHEGVGKYDRNADVFGVNLQDVPGPVVSLIGVPGVVDGKIEIVWPHGNATVTEADRANIGAYLFEPNTLNIAPCQWWPKVQLWASLNNEPMRSLATGTADVRYSPGGSVRMWTFNDIDVSSAKASNNKLFFRVTVDGISTHSSVWSHASDARTYLPIPQLATSTGAVGDLIDARIQVIWPHDAVGNQRSVTEAQFVNVAVDLMGRGSYVSVPTDWDGTVRLHRSLNNDVENFVVVGQKRLITRDGVIYPRWEFNDVPVSAATDPMNKYYFWVTVDGIDTNSNIWAHGADARTYFPQIDVPTTCCR